MDLDGLFSGPCFLFGGSPYINEVKNKFDNKLIVKMVMNNTATIIRPDLWVGADIAENYSASILMDPAPMKFTYITRKNCMIGDKRWRDMPNTYFMASEKMEPNVFYLRGRNFTWCKNVFTLAIQVAYRLGFNEVYLVGCSFVTNKNNIYCYERKLNDVQIGYNQRTYDMALRQIKEILPYAKEFDFKIISCTPGSKINDMVEYYDISQALRKATSQIPSHKTTDCRHPKPD